MEKDASPEYHWQRLKELLDIKDYTLQDMFEDIRRRQQKKLDEER